MCAVLHENATPYRLKYLKDCSPLGGTVSEGLGDVSLEGQE